ncbi:MAG: hypothetical protein LIP16_10775 [Clostridium sp.]|nr:hypothetical protein [Clostridium sp.]
MKKVIAVILAAALSLTGCNSIINSTTMNVGEMAEENRVLPTYDDVSDIMNDMPDYVQVDLSTKYDAPGVNAFFIPDTYSKEKADIRSFNLLGTEGENTVIYSYATKIRSGDRAGEEVHCVAKYNYENKQYQEIHQNIGAVSPDLEAFHTQMLKDTSGVAVYDRGSYYYYGLDGDLKIQASIGDFIGKQYVKNVSTQISSVACGTANRVYFLITIQENEIEEGDGGSVDWDKLEDSIEEEVKSRILVYDLLPLDSSFKCIQDFENFDEAVDYWKDMTEGREFSDEPDAEEDWAEAEDAYPMENGPIYLIRDGVLQYPLYTWDEMIFLSEDRLGKLCTFVVDMNTVKEKKNITDSKFDDRDLAVINGHYYGISGNLINIITKEKEISRTYTYVDEDGDTDEFTQTIEVPSYQILEIDKGFIEGYWLIPDEIPNLYGATKWGALAGKDKTLFWETEIGRMKIYEGLTQNSLVTYDFLERNPYTIIVGEERVDIIFDNLFFSGLGHYQFPFDALIYGYQEGNTEYDQKLKDTSGSIGNLYSQRERFQEWQILNITDNKFLIASQKNGLLYFDGESGRIRQIEKGTWLAVWEEPGGNIVVAGFDNEVSGYDSKDLIYGKIKKYSKADLINSL